MSKNAVMPLSDYVATCDNIREKTETTDLITSGELSEKIDAVYEAGQAQGEREMWDGITNYNTRTDYEKTFSESGYEYITPPYKIYPKYKRTANQTFCIAKMLKKIEAKYFDFSQKERGTDNPSAYYYTFYDCPNLEEIEDIGMQADYGYSTTFANCIKLKKIACVRSDENTLYNGEVFNYCYALEDITFEGVIGQNGLNFRWSTKLTYDSCHSIFTHLKDFREKIVDNYTYLYDWQNPTQILGTHALVTGAEYNLYYSNLMYGVKSGTATAQMINVPNVGNVLGLQYDFSHPIGEGVVLTKYIYQSGDNVVLYETENSGEFETIISFIKAPTETRTITMPTSVRDNGNATPEDIAEATERGWTIVWS